MSEVVLVIHAAATWYMAGLIWFVQIVHYPLMHRVGRLAEAEPARAVASAPSQGGFPGYEAAHQARTTTVVAPPMLIEGFTALWLLVSPPAALNGQGPAGDLGPLLLGLGLALVLVNALSTAIVQMSCHTRLAIGYDPALVSRLVRSNRIRTAAWSARAVIVGGLVLLTVTPTPG